MAQHRPPDHSRGDANTIGGYAAVHDRPAAFEGADGFSYSVEIVTDALDEGDAAWGAYLLFVRWSRTGATSPQGHVETDYLAWSDDEDEARAILSALSLREVKALLDARVADQHGGAAPRRRWWDVMRAEGDSPADAADEGARG